MVPTRGEGMVLSIEKSARDVRSGGSESIGSSGGEGVVTDFAGGGQVGYIGRHNENAPEGRVLVGGPEDTAKDPLLGVMCDDLGWIQGGNIKEVGC